MTASAQIDGRIDWNNTLALLAAQFPAAQQPPGTAAYTTDYGVVIATPTGWRASTPLATGGSSNSSLVKITPLTGTSYQIPAGVFTVDIEPAATIAALTVVFPQAPVDNQNVLLMTSQTITALTLTPGSGATISNAPTTLAANTSTEFRYILASTRWARVI